MNIGLLWSCVIAVVGMLAVLNVRRQLGQPLSHQRLHHGRYYEIVGQCLTDEGDEEQCALVALKPFKPHYGPAKIYRFLSTFKVGIKFIRVYKNLDGEIVVEPCRPE